MASAAPERFSPELLARQPERLTVQYPLERCSRLTELLANSKGTLKAEFELQRQAGKQAGKDGRRVGPHVVVRGTLETTYQVECQRCLQIYTHPVSSEFEFVLVPDEASAEALEEGADPVVLDDDGMITVVQLFEDELILLVPPVPKHETPDECEFAVDVTIDEGFPDATTSGESSSGEPAEGKSSSRNAFSVLKNLRF